MITFNGHSFIPDGPPTRRTVYHVHPAFAPLADRPRILTDYRRCRALGMKRRRAHAVAIRAAWTRVSVNLAALPRPTGSIYHASNAYWSLR